MPSLPELSTANLRNAGDAIETLIEFRDYLPPGGMMLMQAGQFRDQIRALLALPAGPARQSRAGTQDARHFGGCGAGAPVRGGVPPRWRAHRLHGQS